LSTVARLKIEDRLLFTNAVASSYIGNIDGEPPTIETVEKLLENNTKKK
jgi:hypothetical protein